MLKNFIAIGAAVAALFFTYWAGGRIAKERCRADSAIAAVVVNTDISQTKRKINAETYNTGVAEIRKKLYMQYTIAD